MTSSTFYLLFLLPALSLSEVTTFSRCPQFFVRGIPSIPTILHDPSDKYRYEQICQCLLDQNGPKYFYATLYDTRNKIPVYSAYEFNHATVNRTDRWYVEPQLDDGNIICMATQSNINSPSRGKRQALNSDYEGSGYDKGHLFPVYHTHNEETMLATSTLTNAAPQGPSFNRGQWKKHENDLATILMQNCKKAYIVTGVIPGNQAIGKNVRVAKYYWNTYCCFDFNGKTSSAGYMGPDNNGNVQMFTVNDLEKDLKTNYGQVFSVFKGLC
ncbi:endonuclease domain-containing 1 protein [Tachysurus ichikawai]